MEGLYEKNISFLAHRFPGLIEEFQQARPLRAQPQDVAEIGLPGGQDLRIPVDVALYERERGKDLSGMSGHAGLLIWGIRDPDELVFFRHEFPQSPFLYIESDPLRFTQVLQTVDLQTHFSADGARIAFLNDCGRLMAETALAFGDFEAASNRIFVSIDPSMFARLLGDEEHPLGLFVSHIVKNVYLNQSEDEFIRRNALKEKNISAQDVFSGPYLYRAIIQWMKVFSVASPGIRTMYKEMPAAENRDAVYPISIVILAWNRWDLTQQCLRSILNYPLPKNTEILIVDNGSTDVTPRALDRLTERSPIIRSVRLPNNLGPAGGRDAALEHARGKTLIFLDNDVTIRSDRWLSILLEPLEQHPRIGEVGAFGVIHSSDETDTWTQKILFPGLAVPVSWVSSFCVAVRRQAIIDCGGWRPDLYPLYGMEDVALGWAMRSAGWIVAAPGQFVPIQHGMNHRDGHYDYDFNESGRKNTENFVNVWGPRRRILNLAQSNRTIAGDRPSPQKRALSAT